MMYKESIWESKEALLLLFSPLYQVVDNEESTEASILLFSPVYQVGDNDNNDILKGKLHLKHKDLIGNSGCIQREGLEWFLE